MAYQSYVKNPETYQKYGLPKHYGILYAMGEVLLYLKQLDKKAISSSLKSSHNNYKHLFLKDIPTIFYDRFGCFCFDICDNFKSRKLQESILNFLFF